LFICCDIVLFQVEDFGMCSLETLVNLQAMKQDFLQGKSAAGKLKKFPPLLSFFMDSKNQQDFDNVEKEANDYMRLCMNVIMDVSETPEAQLFRAAPLSYISFQDVEKSNARDMSLTFDSFLDEVLEQQVSEPKLTYLSL